MKVFRIVTIALAFTAAAAYVAEDTAFAQSEQDIKEADELFDKGGEKNLKKAAKKYDRAISRDPKGVAAGVYGKRAAIYFLQKKYKEGLEWIDNRALEVYPGAPEILEYKALILWRLDERARAIEIADKVAKDKPDAFQAQLLRGNFYFRRDPETAAQAFERYLRHRPSSLAESDAMPRLKLGLAYLRTDEMDSGVKQCEIVTKQFRKNERAMVNARNCLCAGYTAGGKYNRAITLCEQIIENPRHIDQVGSVWFNLGSAYLRRNQPRKARQAGLEFIRKQASKAKGYILVGDAYFAERNYNDALRYYQRAEERKRNDTQLLKKIGKAYRKLGDPQAALPKLEAAFSAKPDDVELAVELGETYLHSEIRSDARARNAVEKLLVEKPSEEQIVEQAHLRYIAGRALYNTGKLAQAKVRFMEAHRMRPGDVRFRDGLVYTINRQAADDHKKGNMAQALKHLATAYDYDKKSPLTNRNLAVLFLEDGKCDDAKPYITALQKSRRGRVIGDRLKARSYVCSKKPDLKRAHALYARAAKAASGSNRNKLLLAEIYAEWAPLLVKRDLDDAIEKLEYAYTVASVDPLRGEAIRRNLALALYRRGWRHMAKRGGEDEALEDFERASRDKGVLEDVEELAFDFSLAIAYLDNGNTKEASKLFDSLAKAGKQNRYLKAPYDKVGAKFFSAYADYRTNNLKQRRQAAVAFQKMARGAKGKFGQTVNDLVGSAWQYVAAHEYRGGNEGQASRSLRNASRYARSKQEKDLLRHNQAVLSMGKNAISQFSKMGASPPEALVNLGVAYDRAGKPKAAYDAWVQAKKRGVRSKNLDRWIAAKKRIFGY